jgi:hypothetical protein
MLRYVLTSILILSICDGAYAFYETPEHIGALCTACHKNFSSTQPGAENFSAAIGNTDLINMFPCSKKPCHFSSNTQWGGGGDRYGSHMNENICKNCHGKSGMYDIHKSHTINGTAVKCNNCHASLEGWNSDHVNVPPYKEIYVADSAILNKSIRIPDWGGDCGYCHVTLKNAERQHDVHKLVIEDACVECHGEIIESIPNPIKETIIDGEEVGPPEVSLARKIMQEYYVLFENISLQFLEFYNIIIGN